MSKQKHSFTGVYWRHFLFILISFVLVACGGDDPPSDVAPPVGEPTAAPTAAVDEAAIVEPEAVEEPTAVPTPTVTPEPLAAVVNDQPITMAEYERELSRYEQAQSGIGGTDESTYRQTVLDTLIEQALIEQAAVAQNITVTPEEVNARISESVELVGGNENFQSWLAANQYTEEEFREILAVQMLTAEVVNAITADVPTAVEQVRARYLQVDNEPLAQQILAEITAGSEFATQAQIHSIDRITGENGGDLGFFARGSLLVPELEEIAFGLEVGQTSDIVPIENLSGQTTFYIVQLIERDPARPLQDSQRSQLLQETFEEWLTARKNEATIVVYLEG